MIAADHALQRRREANVIRGPYSVDRFVQRLGNMPLGCADEMCGTYLMRSCIEVRLQYAP